MTKDRLRNGGFNRIRKAYNEDVHKAASESEIFHDADRVVGKSIGLFNESTILNEKPIRGTASQISKEMSRKAGSPIMLSKDNGGIGGTNVGYSNVASDATLRLKGFRKALKGAAHEFVHWLYWPASRPKGVTLPTSRYLWGKNNAVGSGEIIARGTELKNYFGLKEGEQLTPEMWDYASRHYLTDLGVKNNGTVVLFNDVDTNSKDFPLFL